MNYDSFLLVSFGGPEREEDIMPFLENVVRGRRVPRERLESVAVHYRHLNGSPINRQNKELLEALRVEFKLRGINLPMYFGNRNWHPFLKDTLAEMKSDGAKKAVSFFTSMFSSYSGCRQYRENIIDAQNENGDGAPIVEKVRMGYNHPKFIEALSDRVRTTLMSAPATSRTMRIIFTAHSIPTCMAEKSAYEIQLLETCRLVCETLGHISWELAYQSRSGAPHVPWLEPDICDVLKQRISEGEESFLIMPVGFISDHVEVLWDLDHEAQDVCTEHGATLYRAPTVGVHPAFVSMIADLVQERLVPGTEKLAVGKRGANHDVCPDTCCLSGV